MTRYTLRVYPANGKTFEMFDQDKCQIIWGFQKALRRAKELVAQHQGLPFGWTQRLPEPAEPACVVEVYEPAREKIVRRYWWEGRRSRSSAGADLLVYAPRPFHGHLPSKPSPPRATWNDYCKLAGIPDWLVEGIVAYEVRSTCEERAAEPCACCGVSRVDTYMAYYVDPLPVQMINIWASSGDTPVVSVYYESRQADLSDLFPTFEAAQEEAQRRAAVEAKPARTQRPNER